MNDSPELSKVLLEWSAVFARLSMRDFMQHTRATGFSISQMNVLMQLYYRGPIEVTSFVELMQVSPAAISQMVERMVQQGLVRREESPTDRRVRTVHLTDHGRQVVEESIAARRRWMESLLASLTEAQEKSIANALQTLTENALRLEAKMGNPAPPFHPHLA
jgi:DNA-binding MarR family transcriptional regulator